MLLILTMYAAAISCSKDKGALPKPKPATCDTIPERITINVENFQFVPASVDCEVGDTIRWVWVSGFHTTTSTSVPAGAATWDSPIDNANTTFTYVMTKAGNYAYWCTPHSPGMSGTINVCQ
jgi:plastocyanin